MSGVNTTPFDTIYDIFLTRVTDSMYMELTEEETLQMLEDLLIASLPRFEFPRFNIFDYTRMTDEENCGYFADELSLEEKNIIAVNMMVEWFLQQLAITENTKMKYSSADFKFTSQANHMSKLNALVESTKTDSKHLQRIYGRRRLVNGEVQSTLASLISAPKYGYNID